MIGENFLLVASKYKKIKKKNKKSKYLSQQEFESLFLSLKNYVEGHLLRKHLTPENFKKFCAEYMYNKYTYHSENIYRNKMTPEIIAHFWNRLIIEGLIVKVEGNNRFYSFGMSVSEAKREPDDMELRTIGNIPEMKYGTFNQHAMWQNICGWRK